MRVVRHVSHWPWLACVLAFGAVMAWYLIGPALLVFVGVWLFLFCWAQLTLLFPLTMSALLGLSFGLFGGRRGRW